MVTSPGIDPADNQLQWVSSGRFNLITSVTQRTVTSTDGVFMANFVSSANAESTTANLMFTVSETENGLVIQCRNFGSAVDTCTLLVCSK